MKRPVSMLEVRSTASVAAHSILNMPPLDWLGKTVKLYGIPRGGIPSAFAVAAALQGSGLCGAEVVGSPAGADVLVDDIYDSGATARRYAEKFPRTPLVVLFDKRKPEWAKSWLVMPWEVTDSGNDNSADDIVTRLLEYIGDDPTREGLAETPKRVLAAWREWATGYGVDPGSVLKTFEDGAAGVNEMVVVHNIPVISKCEHHLADITGFAHIGYIPNGKIVGLSKLPRLADVFARRLQVQERLTNQIADALNTHLTPLGVGVIIQANHACMSTRGVKIHGSTTTTSAFRGVILERPEARSEFLTLCQMAGR